MFQNILVPLDGTKEGLDSLSLKHIIQAISHDRAIPIVLLDERGSDWQVRGNSLHPFRVLVVVDGSKRAEAAIEPAAKLSALLSAPEPGSLHLLGIVRPGVVSIDMDAGKIVKQTNEEAYEERRMYLQDVTKRIFREIVCNVPLHISSSLCFAQDISEVLAAVIRIEQYPAVRLSAIALYKQ